MRTYSYDVENRLISVYQGGVLQVSIAYDPLGRIKRTSTPTVVEQYLWDGDRLVGTIDGSNVPTGRWLHGPGPDEPLAQLLSARRWLLADHQGSVTAETDASGALVGTPYTYDPYGRPDATHQFAGARFRYTGQTAIVPTVPLWHYKARVYDPGIGRFLQTDPIGYEDSLNLYLYGRNDPFNIIDPNGQRPLTAGELAALRLTFGDSVNYSVIDVRDGPGWNVVARIASWSGAAGGITLGNTIFLFGPNYSSDLSLSQESIGILGHEVTHIWQYQNKLGGGILGPILVGIDSIIRGGWGAIFGDAEYDLPNLSTVSDFSQLGYEQQGQVVQNAYEGNPLAQALIRGIRFRGNPSDEENPTDAECRRNPTRCNPGHVRP